MAAVETKYCPNCGEQISARAKFCPSCGARQEDFSVAAPAEAPAEPVAVEAPAELAAPPAAPESPPAEPAPAAEPPPTATERPPAEPAAAAEAPPRAARPLHERIGEVDPQAAELSQLIVGRLALPGMIAAGLAAVAAAAAVFVAGLIIAVVTPDRSLIGVLGQGVGIVTEAFRQAVGTLLAPVVVAGPFNSGSGRLTPMLFLAIPLVAVALATRWQMHRTADARPLVRLGWAAVVAVPFSLLMLAFAILGGHSDTSGISISVGGAFGLGLLWGVVGGVAGAAPALDWSAERTDAGRPWMRAALAGGAAALRPLAAVLVVCAALGLVAWLAGVGASVDEVRGGRSAATALIEEATYVADDGVHVAELGAGARFHSDGPGALGLPIPVSRPASVPGDDGAFRIFSYNAALPAYVFLPALIIVMLLVLLGALYAGFAAARAARAGSVATGAAWGALTGPVWAVAMVILNALAGGFFHGAGEGASVFAVFLLGGALLGAGGGALALSGSAPAARS